MVKVLKLRSIYLLRWKLKNLNRQWLRICTVKYIMTICKVIVLFFSKVNHYNFKLEYSYNTAPSPNVNEEKISLIATNNNNIFINLLNKLFSKIRQKNDSVKNILNCESILAWGLYYHYKFEPRLLTCLCSNPVFIAMFSRVLCAKVLRLQDFVCPYLKTNIF